MTDPCSHQNPTEDNIILINSCSACTFSFQMSVIYSWSFSSLCKIWYILVGKWGIVYWPHHLLMSGYHHLLITSIRVSFWRFPKLWTHQLISVHRDRENTGGINNCIPFYLLQFRIITLCMLVQYHGLPRISGGKACLHWSWAVCCYQTSVLSCIDCNSTLQKRVV